MSCVVYQNDTYCVGGENLQAASNPWISDVFFAPISSGGIVGAWTETTDYGATSGGAGTGGLPVSWPSCVEYNGYIYCVGGSNSKGAVSNAYFAKLSSSGVGPWTETTDYGASSGTTGSSGFPEFQLACVVDSGYVYCVGGGFASSKVFYAPLSSSGVGPWVETTDYGAESGSTGSGGVVIGSTACTDDNGTIYCVGGTVSFSPSSDVFYSQLSSTGVGPWSETTDYGATTGSSGSGGVPIYGTSCIAALSNVICVDGDTTKGAGTNGVYYAKDPPIPVVLRWILDSLPDPESVYDESFITYVYTCTLFGRAVADYYGLSIGGGTNMVNSAPINTPQCKSTITTTTTTTVITTTGVSTPTLTTSISEVISSSRPPSPGSSITIGYSAFDTATLSGGNNPTGSISYYYYKAGDCSGVVDLAGTPTAATGNGPQKSSAQVTPTVAGSYSFRAEFGGDSLNAPTSSACEKLTVLKATPTIFTVLNPSQTITAGNQAYDSAAVNLGYSPTGMVTYYRYSGTGCTGTKTELGGGMLGGVGAPSPTAAPNSPYTTFPNPGTYSYSASYAGDANNNPADSACETLTVMAAASSEGSSSSSSNGSGLLIDAGAALAALAAVAIGGYYVWRRRSAGNEEDEGTGTVGDNVEEPTTPPGPPPTTVSPPPPPPPPPEEPPIQPVAPGNQTTETLGCVQTTRWLHEKIELHVFVNENKERFLTLPYRPVPMGAWGTDSHLLIHECKCPGVDGDQSRETIKVRADTRIKWEIVEGDGEFVKRQYRIDRAEEHLHENIPWHAPITDAKGETERQVTKLTYFQSYGTGKEAEGGQVIFMPQAVPKEGSAHCKVRVTMEHADHTKDPVEHENAVALIEMWISKRGEEFLYQYAAVDEVKYGPGRNIPPGLKGVCRPGHHWRQLEGIEANFTWVDPTAEFPSDTIPRDVIYPNKILANDYVEIMVFQPDPGFGDTDQLQLDCTPSGEGPCKIPAHSELELSDTLVFSWSADRGDFPLLKVRKEWESTHRLTKVVWHAPNKPGDAKIAVHITDTTREFIDPPVELTLDLQVELGEPSSPD